MEKKKIAFVCVHNSCRSQIAEALGNHLRGNDFECYSCGTETKPQVNQDAVRLMKKLYGIDMEEKQFSKTYDKIRHLILLFQWDVMWDVRILADILMITGDYQIQQDRVMKSLKK